MIVDRRKDSYDELMMLSRDSRVSKNKRGAWSTGIVASVVIASGVYVGGSNRHLSDLADAKRQAETQLQTSRAELQRTNIELTALRADYDHIRSNQEVFRDLAIAYAGNPEINNILGSVGPTAGSQSERVLANVVWVVDGSRRFPMTHNDILWVPEGQFWLKLLDARTAGQQNRRPHEIEIYEGPSPEATTREPDETHDFDEDGISMDIGIGGRANRGAADCIRLTLRQQSDRPGFTGDEYVDMEVWFHTDGNCPPLSD